MIKSLLDDNDPQPVPAETTPTPLDPAGSGGLHLFDSTDSDNSKREPAAVTAPWVPEAMDETVRRTGLAWSAGIAFFAAVVFMLVLGWGADLLLGTSPWGIVGGIVLGSIIGFIQFFRTTSQIFKK
jgi:F0F1-type ATP synthase assembly protein I